MRKTYKMTPEQLATLMAACQPVPMIMLQCGNPRSPQERANAAWKALGDEMGFDYKTAEPLHLASIQQFTAVPKEIK